MAPTEAHAVPCGGGAVCAGCWKGTRNRLRKAQATPSRACAARAREGVGESRHRLNVQGGPQGLPPPWPRGHGGNREGTVACALWSIRLQTIC